MGEKIYTYEGKDITVTWDLVRCIHSERCVHGLPQVFDPKAKPWISAGAASPDAVAEAITHCPTGALHYVRKDGGPAEVPDTTNSITVDPDGPNYFRGRLEIFDPSGAVQSRAARVALCRCGGSKNKPYCDLTHAEIGFKDPGNLGKEQLKSDKVDTSDGLLKILPKPKGPLHVKGPFALACADTTVADCNETWLCRCGGSNNKPFCDGTHKKIGFVG